MPQEALHARYGPFRGVDPTSGGPYVADSDAAAASNLSTTRLTGALATARGRKNVTTLTAGGSSQSIVGLAQFVTPGTAARAYIAGISASGSGQTPMVSYNPDTAVQATVANGLAFTQAEQFGPALYTNVGQQVRGGNAYAWQYPACPNPSVTLTAVTQSPTPPSGAYFVSYDVSVNFYLSVQTYYYAFTRLYIFASGTLRGTWRSLTAYVTNDIVLAPNTGKYYIALQASTGFTPGPGAYWQLVPTIETSPYGYYVTGNSSGGSTPPVNLAITSAANAPAITLASSSFTGTASDGGVWTTNVYRQSDAQPRWLFLGNANTNATWIDDVPDQYLAGQAELDPYRDPPPISTSNQGVIFSHKDRMWAFATVSTEDTNNLPQSQLWYSDYGLPSYFNASAGVLLVGDDEPTDLASGAGTYTASVGDMPMAGVSLSSLAVLFKRRATYVVLGDDETTFVVRRAFAPGTCSARSVTVCDDVVTWLSDQGPYLFDGGQKTYIGEKVRGQIESFSVVDRQECVGFYADRTWHLSFPVANVTMRFYLPTREWLPTLPYSTYVAFAVPSESASVGTARFNEVIAARPSTLALDAWSVAETDLNLAITGTWTGPLTDLGSPGVRKQFKHVVLNAPVQSGVTATVTLTVDQDSTYRTSSWTCDLSKGPSFVLEVPTAKGVGFMAQIAASLVNPSTATSPAVIYSLELHADPHAQLVATSTGVT